MVRESLKPPFRSTPESKGNQSLAVWLKGRTTSVSQRIFFKEVGLIYSTFPHHWCFTKYSVHDWWLWTITSLCPSEVLFKAPVASPLTGSPRLGFSLSAKEEGDMSRSNDEEAGGSRRQSFLAMGNSIVSFFWGVWVFLLLFCFDSFWGVLCYFFCVWGGGGCIFVHVVCFFLCFLCLFFSCCLLLTLKSPADRDFPPLCTPRWKQQRYCGELQSGEGCGGCFLERFFWSQREAWGKTRGKSLRNNLLLTFLKMGKVEKSSLNG